MIYSGTSSVVGLVALVGSVAANGLLVPHEFDLPRQVLIAQESCFNSNPRGADGKCYPANSTTWESGSINESTFTMKYYNDAACANEVESIDFPLSEPGCSSTGPTFYTEEYHSYSVLIQYEDAACTTLKEEGGIIYWPEGRCSYEIEDGSTSVVRQQRYTVSNEHNGTIESWLTPVSSFNSSMPCSGTPDNVLVLATGYNITSSVAGFAPCHTWVRFPDFDEIEACVDLGSLVTANRRGRNRWAGHSSVSQCRTPNKFGRMRLETLILSPYPDMFMARVDFKQRTHIWRDYAHLVLALAPNSNFSDTDSFVWKQKLYEDSDVVHYFSPLPDGHRVAPQEHSFGVKLDYDKLIRSDNSTFNFDTNQDYHLYVVIEVDKRDGTGQVLNDCVKASKVKTWPSTTLP